MGVNQMRVFISWSGQLSLQVAHLLEDWIPKVLQKTNMWISTEGIDKGSVWFGDIVRELADTDVGILCLTPENKESRWMHFEAGFLANSLTKSRVCPFLIDLSYRDLVPPFSLFNATLPTRDDVFRLVRTLNAQKRDEALPDARLKEAFDQWWPEFTTRYNRILLDQRTRRAHRQWWAPGDMGEFFRQYYAGSRLQPFARGGKFYPVFCVPCPRSQEEDLNSILAIDDFDATICREFAVRDQQHVVRLESSNRRVDRGLTYVMKRVAVSPHDGTIKVHAQLGTYKDMLSTCDALKEESEDAFAQEPWYADSYEAVKTQLVMRNEYGRVVADPLVDASGRCAALGILTLVVYADESVRNGTVSPTYKALLVQRSEYCATYPGYYHVVPSGVLQPFTANYVVEFDVVRSVYREYAEELFGSEEAQRNVGVVSPDWIYGLKVVQDLESLLRTPKGGRGAQLLLTGYATSAVDLRPQICTLLLITDPQWCRNPGFKFNWEWASFSQQMEQVSQDDKATSTRILTPVDIDQPETAIMSALSEVDVVPEAFAAFWLGVDKAKRIISERG